MPELKTELRLALSTVEASLRSAEHQRQVLIDSQRVKTKKKVRNAMEGIPDLPAVAERVDRLVLFQQLLRNIQMNLTVFRGGNFDLRPNQLRSIHKLVEFLQNEGYGSTSGFIKQPTGAGKTVLFGIIARLCDVPTLILVPKINLLDQTKRELIDVVGFPEEMIGLVGGGYDDYDKPIKIVTYQSHRSLIEKNRRYQSAVQSCQLVVCDEAHRSLGKDTQESLNMLDGEFDDLLTEEEQKAEDDVLNHLQHYTPARALKIGFTATPKLANKHVKDAFGHMIAEEKHADLVKAAILVPYQIVHTDGTISDADLEDGYLTQAKEIEILHRENAYQKLLGQYLGVLTQYKKAKKRNQYPLRGAAFCVKISECDRFAREAKAIGLRTQVVTSRETRGMSPEEADALLTKVQQQLLDQEIDLIVTVTKLAEGWNFPPANAAIWARASHSPALIMQGVGRTARSYEDEKGRKKDFSFVFETDWHKQGENRRKVPLKIADALAAMGENPEDICSMYDQSSLHYTKVDIQLTPDEICHKFLTNLLERGIESRIDFLKINPGVFHGWKFESIGGSRTLYRLLTGETIPSASSLTKDHMIKIADACFPGEEKGIIDTLKSILEEQDLNNRNSFLKVNPSSFERQKFETIGSGRFFYQLATNQKIGRRRLLKSHLIEIADVLFPISDNKLMQQFISALKAAGITSKDALLAIRPYKFQLTEFPPFGKGRKFYTKVVGKNIPTGEVTTERQIEELANVIFG